MTPDEMLFWERAQSIASSFRPDLIAAILQAFKIIRESLTISELETVIRAGAIDKLISDVFAEAMLDRSTIPLRSKLRAATERSFRYFAKQVPKGGMIDGQMAIAFDYLDPQVIDGIRSLESKVITTLKSDVREVVRAFVENGLRDGINPRTLSKEIRDVVGLAPNQQTAVENFRRALMGTNPNATPFDYKLRDRRFDKAIRKGGLTTEQVDKMVDAYRKRFIAWNAETNARTAALDAMKLGQLTAWRQAIDKGIVDGGRLVKSWKGVLDDRERDSHIAMENETVPWDRPYSNGQMIPGDTEFNCRCISRYFVR